MFTDKPCSFCVQRAINIAWKCKYFSLSSGNFSMCTLSLTSMCACAYPRMPLLGKTTCDLKISIIVPLDLDRTVLLTQELMIARYFSWDTFNLVNVFYIWWSTHFKSTEYFFFFFPHFPASSGNHPYQFVFPSTINLMNFSSGFWRSNVFLWLVFKMWFTGTKMTKLSKFELFRGKTITFSVPFLLKFSVKNMSVLMLVIVTF